jgi:hypothetical protein
MTAADVAISIAFGVANLARFEAAIDEQVRNDEPAVGQERRSRESAAIETRLGAGRRCCDSLPAPR